VLPFAAAAAMSAPGAASTGRTLNPAPFNAGGNQGWRCFLHATLQVLLCSPEMRIAVLRLVQEDYFPGGELSPSAPSHHRAGARVLLAWLHQRPRGAVLPPYDVQCLATDSDPGGDPAAAVLPRGRCPGPQDAWDFAQDQIQRFLLRRRWALGGPAEAGRLTRACAELHALLTVRAEHRLLQAATVILTWGEQEACCLPPALAAAEEARLAAAGLKYERHIQHEEMPLVCRPADYQRLMRRLAMLSGTERLPPVLFVFVRRVVCAGGTRTKDRSPVNPLWGEFLCRRPGAGPQRYVLAGLQAHLGGSARKGHYVALTREHTRADSDWWYLDDLEGEPTKHARSAWWRTENGSDWHDLPPQGRLGRWGRRCTLLCYVRADPA